MSPRTGECGRILQCGRIQFASRDTRQYENAKRLFGRSVFAEIECQQRAAELMELHGLRDAEGRTVRDLSVISAVRKLGVEADWSAVLEEVTRRHTARARFVALDNFAKEKWLAFVTSQPYGTPHEDAVRDLAARRLASDESAAVLLRTYIGGLRDTSAEPGHPVGYRLSFLLETYMENRSVSPWDRMVARDRRVWLKKVVGHASKLADALNCDEVKGNGLFSINEMVRQLGGAQSKSVLERSLRLRVAAAIRNAEQRVYLQAGLPRVRLMGPQHSLGDFLREFARQMSEWEIGDRPVGHASADGARIRNFLQQLDACGLFVLDGHLPDDVMAACINTLFQDPENPVGVDEVKQIRADLSTRKEAEVNPV